MSSAEIENNTQLLEDGQWGEIVKSSFGAKLVNHAAVRVAYLIAQFYKLETDLYEVEPMRKQVDSAIANVSEELYLLNLDDYINDETIDDDDLLTQAIFDIVKKTGKFHIDYGYQDDLDIEAKVVVLFENVEMEVLFKGENGEESENYLSPIHCSKDSDYNEELYKDFDFF